jgi:two-component system, NarL family, response regulator NreC
LEPELFLGEAFGTRKIRCLLVDSHALIRHGMRRLLEDEADIEVVEEAGTVDEALQKLCQLQPDLVLMDTAMPGLSSLEAVRLIQHTSPRTRLIFLTGHGDNESALHGLQAGAMGYVHKDTAAPNLVQAMRDVHRGIRYVSPQVLQRVRKDSQSLSTAQQAYPPSITLTPRQQEIVKLLAEGQSVRGIAEILGVSAKTVDAHKFTLMRKLGIHNKAQLVTYAIQKRIVKPAGM